MTEIAHGFVDLQVNGWSSVDFSTPGLTSEGFANACRDVLKSGTAAFLPTIITSELSVYESNLPVISAVIRETEFRERVLGVHIEGPFISADDGPRGAHPREHVHNPDPALLDRLVNLSNGCIRMITLAAETPGAADLTDYAAGLGICVSLGHQLANEMQIENAVKSGARALTHLGNGMPAVVNRHSNPLLAGLANDELYAMIITDGHHLPDALIKIVLRVKGAERTVVTSDATALTGMPPGKYRMFGADVIRDESGKVYNPLTGYLAGSGSTMFECMNHLASLNLLSPSELVKTGFINPLKLIGIDQPPGIAPPYYDENRGRFTVDSEEN